MKKYLLISRKYKEFKRGAYTTSLRLVEKYSSYLDHIEDIYVTNLKELNDKYQRLIFVSQSPNMYRPRINFLTLKDINHLMFIRDEFHPNLYSSANNGFYYYLDNPKIDCYIPFVTDFTIDDDFSDINNPCIGVYYRRFLVRDSYEILQRFIDNLSFPIDMCFMGDVFTNLDSHPNIRKYYATTDNNEFFKKITHYLHLNSRYFIDPFPNATLEAIQCGKQIIFYGPHRNFRDGVDDIKDVILYHTDFNPDVLHDNSLHPLTSDMFDKFYLELFENNFEYVLDRFKYKSFSDWIEKEVMS